MHETFQDNNGCWHENPRKNSNNVYIYGAYARALNLDVSKYPDYFKKCVVKMDRNEITINRHPNQTEPPFSHDEAMGAFYLGLIPYDALKGNHFVYHGKGKPFNMKTLQDLFGGMLELIVQLNLNLFMPKSKKVKQRNLFWERKITKLYGVAFRHNPAQIFAIKKSAGKKYHREEKELFNFYRDCMMKNKDNSRGKLSEKNMLWLMLVMVGDEGRARKLKPWINFERYFGAEHPFTWAIKLKYGIQ